MEKDRVRIVQFPHPSREHDKNSGIGWHVSRAHRRRFMVHRGIALDGGVRIEDALCFWGEWEAGACKPEDFSGDGPNMPERYFRIGFREMPRSLASEREKKIYVHNTDPLVFGDAFYYLNCKQRGDGKLKHLSPSSLILFGSVIAKQFCLDTVFVVSSSTWYTPNEAAKPTSEIDSQLLRNVAIEPLRFEKPRERFRSYRGLMQGKGESVFSFVPCSTLSKHKNGFARPRIVLDQLINPNSHRNVKITDCSGEQIVEAWNSVVEQVQAQGLMLGIRFEEPTRL